MSAFAGCCRQKGEKKFRAENYDELTTDMITNFFIIGSRLSLKMPILLSYIDKFIDNMGVYQG